ncbi:hypothetical protein LAZ67_X004065 [Cordylochernes scorpioides]|uniref:Uncharacterized protein n=1 Tax=Cordylochernes scorpioides TaxID=51811 RepID=A0ABY6LUM3_9ARAC|nr:hypothetical protein LAZ67_X004065 [Cordylochernes scorpioides]
MISENGIEPTIDKTETFKEFPIMKNVKQDFEALISVLSEISQNKPLTCLAGKDKQIVIYIYKIVRETNFSTIQPKSGIDILTEVSMVSLGAFLMQPDKGFFALYITY